MNWVFEHSEDSDFNDLPAGAINSAQESIEDPGESVGLLMSFGFSYAHSLRALKATGYDIDR